MKRYDIADSLIVEVRGQRVILASSLAEVYDVPVKALNQAVGRNTERFPSDFVFRLTLREAEALRETDTRRRSRSQNVTLKRGQNVKYRPLAFTEHGAVMAASVLKSKRAAEMSVFVVRAFLRLREWVAQHTRLAKRLDELESRVDGHDEQMLDVIRAVRRLIEPAAPPTRRRIGFSAVPVTVVPGALRGSAGR